MVQVTWPSTTQKDTPYQKYESFYPKLGQRMYLEEMTPEHKDLLYDSQQLLIHAKPHVKKGVTFRKGQLWPKNKQTTQPHSHSEHW